MPAATSPAPEAAAVVSAAHGAGYKIAILSTSCTPDFVARWRNLTRLDRPKRQRILQCIAAQLLQQEKRTTLPWLPPRNLALANLACMSHPSGRVTLMDSCNTAGSIHRFLHQYVSGSIFLPAFTASPAFQTCQLQKDAGLRAIAAYYNSTPPCAALLDNT